MTDGPTDWAIVDMAVRIVEDSVNQWGGNTENAADFNKAEAYRLVYKYLVKQKDPLNPGSLSEIYTLLSVAGD